MSYTIDIEGVPAPKGSMVAAKTKAGKPYTYPSSKHERPWIQAVRNATESAMRHHEQLPPPYVVDLTFRLKLPAHPSEVWPTATDLDKLARAVLDGLVKGGALADDRHVVELHARKRYCSTPQAAGVSACISRALVPVQQAA